MKTAGCMSGSLILMFIFQEIGIGIWSEIDVFNVFGEKVAKILHSMFTGGVRTILTHLMSCNV
jgi:hypothetical protein